MSSVVISGNTSGSVSLVAPDVAGSSVQTLASVSGTLAPLVSGTAVTASGTSVDFTGIPSWVKRITVMFDGVSTSGTSPVQIQLGDSGGIETTNYFGSHLSTASTAILTSNVTTGFQVYIPIAGTDVSQGILTICNTTSNNWSAGGGLGSVNSRFGYASGSKALSSTLDRIRITTVNGTDTFDAGTINIMYE